MNVYRVEYPDNHQGPYNPDDGSEDAGKIPEIRYTMASRLMLAHGWSDRHPPLSIESGPIFGFRSMRDLYGWFGGYVPSLIRAGARIAVYSISPSAIVAGDQYQIAFNPS